MEPVLLPLVRLEEEEEEEEVEVDMRVARSSYLAWDSRGSWPKRPKAHGAAVDVGNREKEAILEDEDDIYDSGVMLGWWDDWVAYSLWSVSGAGEGECRKKASLGGGHHPRVLCLYLFPAPLMGRRL